MLITENEAHEELITNILYFYRFESPETKYLYLWSQYENSGDSENHVSYMVESAWEFQELLIFTLEMAAETNADFIHAYKAVDLLPHDDSLLKRVEKWMGYAPMMVHDSAIFKVHIEALDGDITDLMRTPDPPLAPVNVGNKHADLL